MAVYTIEKILLHYEPKKENLLPAIKEINSRLSFLSSKAVYLLAQHFRIKPAEVFSTASFYEQIKTKRSARIIVQVCDSANCQIKMADKIIIALETFLQQKAGDDFSSNIKIERISCLGHCARGPNMVVNDTLYNQVDAGKAVEILNEYI